jgi:quercetin dioxygenase-like cupin family protein
MTPPYTLVADLAKHQDMPADGILTRTIHADENVKVVLFTFSARQELSEHTASMPAILQFVQGEAELGLGEDKIEARPGTWVHMPALTKHSIRTKSPVTMLLTLVKA